MTVFRVSGAIGLFTVLLTQPTLAQKTPDPIFNGRDVAFELSPASALRRGDRLTDTLVATVWVRTQVKGSGTCSATACPVTFNGEEVFARRTRMTIVGNPGSSGNGVDGAMRKLKRGDSGADVTRLQEALLKQGVTVTVDGSYGRGTIAAVSDFQRKRRLKVDGIAGAETLKELGV
jgi:Putative peptidoglycan binding domain